MLNTSSSQAASEYVGKARTFKSDIQELWDQRSTQIRYAPLLFLEWENQINGKKYLQKIKII